MHAFSAEFNKMILRNSKTICWIEMKNDTWDFNAIQTSTITHGEVSKNI